jgi:hypothetical protein
LQGVEGGLLRMGKEEIMGLSNLRRIKVNVEIRGMDFDEIQVEICWKIKKFDRNLFHFESL